MRSSVSNLFKRFPQFAMINTVKGFSFADETEADVFLEFPCFCYEPVKNRNNDRPHFLGVHIH